MSAAEVPDPATASTPAEFRDRMKQLRLWAGRPSLRQLEQLGGTTHSAGGHRIKALPASTMSYVLNGKSGGRLPRLRFVEHYVTSCLAAPGQPVADEDRYRRRWIDAWRQLAGQEHAASDAAPTVVETVAHHQLPMDIVEFTGRAAELARLRAMAEAGAGNAPTIVAVEGMAGVGKTRLAVHAAHQMIHGGLFGDLQLWADLHGFDPAHPAADTGSVLDRFLRLLGVPAQHIPADLDARAALYRDRLAGRRALVLLDNAVGEEQLRPLLPASPDRLVLITSRRSLAGMAGIEPLHLDRLSTEDGIALLTRLAGCERFRDDPESAARTVALCGGLPIAICLAARRLRSRAAWTPADLIARLDRHSQQVHASFALSYEDLDAGTRRLFRLLALHPGTDVNLVGATRLAGQHDLPAVVWQLPAVLLQYFYLRSRWDDWITTHNLGLTAARGLDDQCGQAKILNGLGVAYSDRRQFAEAIDCYEEALRLFTGLHDLHGQAWTRNNLGVAHVDLDQLPEAVEKFRPALAAFRELQDQPAEALCLNNLGDALRRQGHPAQAIEHLRDALALQRRTNDRAGQRFTLHSLADLHRAERDYERAVRYYRQTHALSQELGDQWGCRTRTGPPRLHIGHDGPDRTGTGMLARGRRRVRRPGPPGGRRDPHATHAGPSNGVAGGRSGCRVASGRPSPQLTVSTWSTPPVR